MSNLRSIPCCGHIAWTERIHNKVKKNSTAASFRGIRMMDSASTTSGCQIFVLTNSRKLCTTFRQTEGWSQFSCVLVLILFENAQRGTGCSTRKHKWWAHPFLARIGVRDESREPVLLSWQSHDRQCSPARRRYLLLLCHYKTCVKPLLHQCESCWTFTFGQLTMCASSFFQNLT